MMQQEVHFGDGSPQELYTSIGDRNARKGKVKMSVKLGVWIMKLIVLVTVTVCLVFSKLTVVAIFGTINHLVRLNVSNDVTYTKEVPRDLQLVANLYWQLLFIMMIPSVISWLYSIFKGLFSQSWTHPWPRKSAMLFGIFIAALEAVSECILYFAVFVAFPPVIVIFLMSGVFSVQGMLNIYLLLAAKPAANGDRNGFDPIGSTQTPSQVPLKLWVKLLLAFVTLIGLICQMGGLTTITALAIKEGHALIPMGCLLLVCLFGLSFAWTNTIQKLTFYPNEKDIRKAREHGRIEIRAVSAGRWKACFISSTTRLILYPVVSYCIVRFFYQLQQYEKFIVDPWCIPINTNLTISQAFQWQKHNSAVFGVHIVSSFLAQVVQFIACYMTLHFYGLALPVFLATPITVAVYFISNSQVNLYRDQNLFLFPFTNEESDILNWSSTITSKGLIWIYALAFVMWVGQLLITWYNLSKNKNAILASNEEMFVRPYYSSVLMEQYLAINRCVVKSHFNRHVNRDPAHVFICSTMYRENPIEMRQLLQSIYRVAQYYKAHKEDGDHFESHIFFDGGCNGEELSRFAIQLMSLVAETLKVDLRSGVKVQTPYGYRFRWILKNCMPFVVHLKDNIKIKNKKRWSQVMYMNYVINHRAKTDSLDPSNTFILTTDADIDFKAEAAVALLDMLARDDHVGGVCARTYPLGAGLMYWYQIFDYAIGHWLQKGGEHILGSVLCCPGCFSMFRCAALKDCIEEYSSEVGNAMEFLMKDMGEDRWLCTLLVEKGWRLEYCAISTNHTYCPIEFDEFFKQRRRWIPSTIANLWLLVSQGKKMTSHNESVGWLFILYQALIIIATVISPATVILIMASGLQTFGFDSLGVVISMIIFCVIYGLVCMYGSQQTQLDVAKLFAFLFSILMAAVMVGIIKAVLHDVIQESDRSRTENSTHFEIPIGETSIYLGLFAIIFVITAICHYNEFFSLFHCLWYLLGLPSGYLLLLIYSAANLNSRSWGTREKNDGTDGITVLVKKNVKELLRRAFEACQMKSGKQAEKDNKATAVDEDESKPKEKHHPKPVHSSLDQPPGGGLKGPPKDGLEGPPGGGLEGPPGGGLKGSPGGGLEGPPGGGLEGPPRGGLKGPFRGGLERPPRLHTFQDHGQYYPYLKKWLRECGCEQFYDLFANEGYTDEKYISTMTEQDLRDIGVKPHGYVRHLIKSIKKMPASHIHSGVPKDVASWINELEMGNEEDGYIDKFFRAGYFGHEDVENLQLITQKELVETIGVYKKAHVKRFLQAFKNLKYCSKDEEQMMNARYILITNDQPQSDLQSEETAFWYEQLEESLQPIPEALGQISGLKDELQYLRSSVLVAVLLINLIWIILISLFTVDELNTSIGLSNKFLSLVFLAVYGLILLVQFLAMLFHRTVTLAHYISRLNQSLPVAQTQEFLFTQTQRFN